MGVGLILFAVIHYIINQERNNRSYAEIPLADHVNKSKSCLGPWGRKFQGTKVPPMELSLLGAKVRGNESSIIFLAPFVKHNTAFFEISYKNFILYMRSSVTQPLACVIPYGRYQDISSYWSTKSELEEHSQQRLTKDGVQLGRSRGGSS